MTKKIIGFLLCVALLCTMAGCSESYQDAIIYFELPEKPVTLDPQTASSDAELAIVRNVFEGLYRKNESGAIVYGAAENVEKDGLTYTFTLRDDMIWSDKTPVTSDDFLFAFQRAVLPDTAAPYASRLFAIENAEQIHRGSASLSSLGVTTPDEKTLVIHLTRQDDDFEDTLTTSVAMPCNRAFFEQCAGFYGLQSDSLLSCGSYRLTKWNQEVFGIRLYKNAMYTGTFEAQNSAVYITKNEEKTPIERLVDHNVDLAFVDPSLKGTIDANGLKMVEVQNVCWFLTMNDNLSYRLRTSLAMLVGSEVYGEDLPHGYTRATSIYPSVLAQNVGSDGLISYDLSAAKAAFHAELENLENKKFPSGVTLRYYDNGVIKPVVTDIVGHWQNNIGAFVNIAAYEDLAAFDQELQNKTFDMAVFPVAADSQIVSEYLEKFGVTAKGESAETIQKALLKDATLVPLFYQSTAIAYTSDFSSITVEPSNGYVDFSFIVKVE